MRSPLVYQVRSVKAACTKYCAGFCARIQKHPNASVSTASARQIVCRSSSIKSSFPNRQIQRMVQGRRKTGARRRGSASFLPQPILAQ